MEINSIIIIGGGTSIEEGISLGLKEKIQNKCVFVCNYAYKHFSHTLLTCIDKDFYVPYHAKSYDKRDRYPDIYNELKKESLILLKNSNQGWEEFILPNTICINSNIDSPLTGLFALEIACKLKPKQIFLLGYDFTRQEIPKEKSDYNPHGNKDIHYYKDVQHFGTGYTGFYDNHNPDKYFGQFNKENNIYNVSLISLINVFPKISYNEMFNLMTEENWNQDTLRKTIKNSLPLF